jgi:maleate isomerase
MPSAHPGASYGWRVRFGVLQPGAVSDNNPFEFYLMAPPGVQMFLTSLGVQATTEEGYARAMAGLEQPVKRLLARNVDVLVQAGVPPIVTAGWGSEEKLRARVAALTDVPYVTDIGCCIDALQAVSVRKVAVLTRANLQQGLPEYLSHAGIDVVASADIEAPDGEEMCNVPLSLPYRAAVALRRGADAAEGILILGAFMPTVGMIEALEEAIGLPVVSSAQAMMWAGLRHAGVPANEVVGFGKLFQAA